MRRPRWHDALIVLAIFGIAAAGVWAFWGEELGRRLRGGEPVEKAPPAAPII
jgi:hypothetical protein